MRKEVSKLFKIFLSLSLLFTGALLNTNAILANGIEERGSAVNMWIETDEIIADLGSGGIVYLRPKYQFAQTQGNTTMTYYGKVSATAGNNTTKHSDQVTYYGGTCSLNTTDYMIIEYTIVTTYNSKKYETVYKIIYQYNQIKSKYVLSQERL